MADPRPLAPLSDMCAGDLTSLVRLGVAEPPPTPGLQPVPPPPPDPVPPPGNEEQRAELSRVLVGIGIEASAEDQAAVKALATLDTATLTAVKRWLNHKRTKPEPVK